MSAEPLQGQVKKKRHQCNVSKKESVSIIYQREGKNRQDPRVNNGEARQHGAADRSRGGMKGGRLHIKAWRREK